MTRSISTSSSGKEHLKAACSDLERIGRLKKEAEFLEASFCAKADSLQQGDDGSSGSYAIKQPQYTSSEDQMSLNFNINRRGRVYNKSCGLWNFLFRRPSSSSDPGSSTANTSDIKPFEKAAVSTGVSDSDFRV